MKDKRLLIVFTVLLLICSLFINIKADAASRYYISATDGVNVRKGPGTNYSTTGDMLYYNEELTVIEKKANEQGCSNDWYHIKYRNNTKEGYVCGTYVKEEVLANIDENGEYEQYLREQGFPESYWAQLKTLHNAHSNWVFKAVKTNLDFNDAVDNESTLGKSLIDGSDTSLRSKESPAYDATTGIYKQYEPGWYAASRDTVKYYLDHRNFLSEKTIFMFEKLDYNSSYQTKSAVEKILGSSYMVKLYPNYADAFLEAAGKYNISPIHLASRVRQETSLNGSISSSGESFVYAYDPDSNQGNNQTYSGLYNFYNIGAYGYMNPAIRGLIWANGGVDGSVTSYGRPWNSPYKAILGGAQYIAEGYISQGQNTVYFEKFNVKPGATNDVYTHQYMTNIRGHVSEAETIYNSYKNIGIMNEAFVFEIPVYENMDSASDTNTPSSGDNNSNGSNNTSLSVNTIATNIGVKVNSSYMSGISLGTTGNDIVNRIKTLSSNASVSISNNGKLGTGNTITISSNGESRTYTVIVYGDPNGDGTINIFDLVRTQKIILNTVNASESQRKAADANKDGTVNIFDLVRIQKHVLNVSSIEQ